MTTSGESSAKETWVATLDIQSGAHTAVWGGGSSKADAMAPDELLPQARALSAGLQAAAVWQLHEC